jgi:hypothetical protein
MLFTKSYEVKGKHATYIRFLNSQTKKKGAGIFKIAVDVYIISPLIGVAYNLRSPVDLESTDHITIFGEQLLNHHHDIETVYRLVMLTDKSVDLTFDERIERAFKTDEDQAAVEANLDVFHQYMRGGVEWLYDHVTEGGDLREDYLDGIKDLVFLYADDFRIPRPSEDFAD